MIYLTQTRLMLESERTIADRARSGDEIARRVCGRLLADESRYRVWHSRHEYHMSSVALRRRREKQICALRAVSIEQVHRTALVQYLRDHRITGIERDRTLRELYGVTDARESAITEHRHYLVATSTQLCATEILELVGDKPGLDLVNRYELAYGQYFGMFCERARALQAGQRYLLAPLLPEVRDAAARIRLRLLDSAHVPMRASPGPQITCKPARVRVAARF